MKRSTSDDDQRLFADSKVFAMSDETLARLLYILADGGELDALRALVNRNDHGPDDQQGEPTPAQGSGHSKKVRVILSGDIQRHFF